ncbi:MAG TPA: hypothetical protein VNO30_44000 [Kofleriaceae bacterium]|nr:hypothetical protein [Kofleriaceae bacterium]
MRRGERSKLRRRAAGRQRAAAAALAVLAALAALFGPACAGPCRSMEAARRALAATPEQVTRAPHARIQLPFPVANRLIADALAPPPELPVSLLRLGPLAGVIGDVRAIPREVVLGPAATPGRVHASVRIELADKTGALLWVRASGDVAPVLERRGSGSGTGTAGADGTGGLDLVLDLGQLSRLEPELGPRAQAELGALLEARLPAAVRDRTPRFVIDRVAAAVVEEAIEQSFRLLRGALLPRLRERTQIRVELPDVPLARVDVTTTPAALALDVFTTLPVRAGVGAAPPVADAISVQIAGDAATRGANWGISHGALPPRYTRTLKPDRDGAYVPHFEWRPGDPVRPLVVHMFRVEGGCAHFAVGVLPRLEVVNGRARAWIDNRRLEQADGPLVLELLARTKALVERSTSAKQQGPGSVRLTVGGREVTTRLLAAEVAGDELRAAVAVAVAPAPAPAPPPPPAPGAAPAPAPAPAP